MKFSKMHGLGNDFVVINNLDDSIHLTQAQIAAMADRHLGVGFDQLLLLQKSTHQDADFDYKIFNADGTEVEQCGNGARCLALFIKLKKLSPKISFRFATLKHIIVAEIINDEIKINMGIPRILAPITLRNIKMQVVDMGNPHVVIWVEDIAKINVTKIGKEISLDPFFLHQTNVNFAQILNHQQLKLRTYERGVGETMACGSGACASVAAGIAENLLDHQVEVKMKGGALQISWMGGEEVLWVQGPAVWVFDGEINDAYLERKHFARDN